MRTVVLNRMRNLVDRTLGWEFIFDDDGLTILFKFATLEPPWRENARGEWDEASRIMAGLYIATAEIHKEKGYVLRFHDVPGRDGILQHRGTIPKNTRGCICFGLAFNAALTEPCRCAKAQEKLQALIPPGTKVMVRIIDAA